jgi:hypothetical protein
LAWKDIISNHSVPSEIECSFNCGNEPTCAGFKYKFGTNSPSVNCQLSKTTGKNNIANYDDQGYSWVFFIDVTKKLVCILKVAPYSFLKSGKDTFQTKKFCTLLFL